MTPPPWPLHRLPADLWPPLVLVRGHLTLAPDQPVQQCATTAQPLEAELSRCRRPRADLGAVLRRQRAGRN